MANWVTVAQISKDLDINESTVRRWLDQKLIPGSKIGSTWKIDRERYYSWLKQHTDNVENNNE